MASLFDDYRTYPAAAADARARDRRSPRPLAASDWVTGTPDRARVLDRLQQAMGIAMRHRKRVAVVLLELDGLDGITDDHGECTADDILRQVTSVLRSCLRGGDMACRYGLAEFVLMLPAVEDVDGVTAVVRKIRAQLAKSFSVECSAVPVTVTVGLALYPGDGGDFVELLGHADFAMYLERTRGCLQATPGLRDT